MSEELRPCPFCGAMPEKLRTGYMCSTLGCALQENTVSEKEWNTRPIEDALQSRIAELEAERHWIPVSEGLPEGEKVLVLWKDGSIHLDWTFIDGGSYYWWNSGQANVTHWMPLPSVPEPPEVK